MIKWELSEREITIIDLALQEDLAAEGDLTTQALVAEHRPARAHIIAREACVLSGMIVAQAVFSKIDPRTTFHSCLNDGDPAGPGTIIARIEGPARALLTAERTALNFLQRMTGIATLTREFVRRAQPHNPLILDTRKTTPALRSFEKYAVRCGGGTNHRFGLHDRIMIKDNHRALWAEQQGGKASLADAVRRARSLHPRVAIEVEVETLGQMQSVLPEKPEWILLDNMPPERMRACVEACAGRCLLEASGGITLENVEAVARTGVNAISLGCLTHSARAIDLSLEME